jgi:hypothetical protein
MQDLDCAVNRGWGSVMPHQSQTAIDVSDLWHTCGDQGPSFLALWRRPYWSGERSTRPASWLKLPGCQAIIRCSKEDLPFQLISLSLKYRLLNLLIPHSHFSRFWIYDYRDHLGY